MSKSTVVARHGVLADTAASCNYSSKKESDMAKKKYLCIQRSQQASESGKPSPAQMEEMFAKFNAWKEKFAANIVDMGG
ncbi:MAG: hypothetical protein WBD31_28380 [Rubripirellula sp.]